MMNLSILLSPLSLLFGAVATVRGKLFDWGILRQHSFATPIICVGNLSVGGTGKTPHVEHILRLLHAEGLRVAMLSRGYGRHTRGYVLAEDGVTARELGDEPFQVWQNCPYATVAVCEKRVEGIHHLLQLPSPPEVIVLDDAYQHRYVKAGLNILLTDSHRLFTHDHLLPWGRLREPASAARRAQAIVVTKCDGDRRPSLMVDAGQQLFYSRISYAPLQPAFASQSQPLAQPHCSGRKVLLVAAIANPQPLLRHLEAEGAQVGLMEFRDHHDFTSSDARRITREWREGNYQMAVTTQKDVERLQHIATQLPAEWHDNLYVQPITVEVATAHPEQQPFNQIIIDYVTKNQRNS